MDPYEVLGISQGATQEEIKATFRHKARQWHPDMNTSQEATEQFQRIQLAHDQLTGKTHAPTTTAPSSETSSASHFMKGGMFEEEGLWQFMNRLADDPHFAFLFEPGTARLKNQTAAHTTS